MATMQELLREAADMGASDLHLSAGEPPLLRVQGDLLRTDHHPLTPENVTGLINSIIPDAQRGQFKTEHEADFACCIDHLIMDELLDGVINVSAPKPLPNREFMGALRHAWGTRVGLPARQWVHWKEIA